MWEVEKIFYREMNCVWEIEGDSTKLQINIKNEFNENSSRHWLTSKAWIKVGVLLIVLITCYKLS